MKTLFRMLLTVGVIACLSTFVKNGQTMEENFTTGAIIGGLLVGYLLPTFIAFGRGHSNAAGIMIFNVFLGWTFVSWIWCLIASMASAVPVVVHHVHTGQVEHYPNLDGGPRASPCTINYTEHQS